MVAKKKETSYLIEKCCHIYFVIFWFLWVQLLIFPNYIYVAHIQFPYLNYMQNVFFVQISLAKCSVWRKLYGHNPWEEKKRKEPLGTIYFRGWIKNLIIKACHSCKNNHSAVYHHLLWFIWSICDIGLYK